MGRIHYSALLLLLLVFLLVSSSSASSQGTDGRISLDEKAVGSSPASLEEDFSTLMGEVVCEEKDEEECLKRRMVAEAHLDYIYTQSHNHP